MSDRLLAVVTGASSGIGEEFARQLAGRGYDVLLVARREDRLHVLAEEITAAQKVSVEAMATDLETDEGRDRVAERIHNAANFGLLVNNAGFGAVGLFHQASLDLQDRMHRLHVLTTVALSHAALENLAATVEAFRPRALVARGDVKIGFNVQKAFERFPIIMDVGKNKELQESSVAQEGALRCRGVTVAGEAGQTAPDVGLGYNRTTSEGGHCGG